MERNRMKKEKEMVMQAAGGIVATVIGCMVLVPEAYRYQVLFIAGCIWAVVLYCRLQQAKRQKQRERRAAQIVDFQPDYRKLFAQQVQLRIQEKLCKKFPDAAVDLSDADAERLATQGKALYVPIRKADHYCHIGIQLENTGAIQMQLFSYVNLDNVQGGQGAEANAEPDVEQWFTQSGQQLLTELITNMNSRGYSKLSINENGDVTVKENGRNVRKDHFREIPAKKHWARLKELMEEDGIQVQVSGRQLTFAW